MSNNNSGFKMASPLQEETTGFIPTNELEVPLESSILSGASSSVIAPNEISPLPSPPSPLQVRFSLDKNSYKEGDTLKIRNGWVFDDDGVEDIKAIQWQIQEHGKSIAMLGKVENFTKASWDNRWFSFQFEINLEGLNLSGGDYYLGAIASEKSGEMSPIVQRSFRWAETLPNSAPTSLQFSLNQTEYKTGDLLKVRSGWVYDREGGKDLDRVELELLKNGSKVAQKNLSQFNTVKWSQHWVNFEQEWDLSGFNLTEGEYQIRGIAYDKAQAQSNEIRRSFTFKNPALATNIAPQWLQFRLDQSSYKNTDTLNITNGWVFDQNGAKDLERIEFTLWQNGTSLINPEKQFKFTPLLSSPQWAQFNDQFALSAWNLNTGNYTLKATAFDRGGLESNHFTRDFSVTYIQPKFTAFNLWDASLDNTQTTVFKGGAIRFNYDLAETTHLQDVRLEVLQNNTLVKNLGSWTESQQEEKLINLNEVTELTGGLYQFQAVARTQQGDEIRSNSQNITLLDWQKILGTLAGDRIAFNNTYSGNILVGRGGTDTLLLGVDRTQVTQINGIALNNYNPLNSTTQQALFQGSSFDFITLNDGREIYFQGFENLEFTSGDRLELQIRANDTYFNQQWNLRASDVESAWRFSRGSQDILLVSLDTGILTAAGASGSVYDLNLDNRLITDSSDADGYKNYGHGHSAVTIMAGTANNNTGVTGINWESPVYITNVYQVEGYGVNLQQAINDALNYAKTQNKRVVFQGGIQGDYWLQYSGGTREQLETLLTENQETALFAMAAGNGNLDIDNTTNSNSYTLGGGVSRLQTTHENVISVGALQATQSNSINGLKNATTVDRATYSNYGESLTLMAATDSPAITKNDQLINFGGTSAANPNMAGIASLVWSVNVNLTAGEIRQILIDTAMDLLQSNTSISAGEGKDNAFGNGLVNADSAIRRAVALERDRELASLYLGRSNFA